MYSRMLTACLMTMLIASCVTRGSVPVVVDTACDWVKPIYLTDHDIDVRPARGAQRQQRSDRHAGLQCHAHHLPLPFVAGPCGISVDRLAATASTAARLNGIGCISPLIHGAY